MQTPPEATSNKAFFLDRDGVINEDTGYVHSPETFQFKAGIIEFLKTIQDHGYLLIVVTNQSGIGRGYYTEADYQHLTTWMIETLAKHDIHITQVYHCPHSPDSHCDCRKPKPGMIQQAITEHTICPQTSWLLGDKPSDIEAAAAATLEYRLYLTETNTPLPLATANVSSLQEAQNLFLKAQESFIQ